MLSCQRLPRASWAPRETKTLPESPHLSSLGCCLAPRVARLRFVTHGDGSTPKAALSSISQGEARPGAALQEQLPEMCDKTQGNIPLENCPPWGFCPCWGFWDLPAG